MNVSATLIAAAVISAQAGVAAADAPAAAGFWVTPNHGVVVEVGPCDTGLCGRLVGLRTDHKPGDVPRDSRNPDKTKQSTPICGLVMMGALKPVQGSITEWDGGWVYDPESGSTYKAEMHMDGPDKLKLRGYIGLSLFGRTQDWTRETGDVKNRCTPPADG